MNHTELGEMENRFAQLIWKHQPISSGELTRLCEQEFEWKKSTTYTMLKRLCQRGIFENENGMVKALISQEEFYAEKGARVIKENFGGSLPRFLAAFVKKNALGQEEIDQLQQLIDQYKGE